MIAGQKRVIALLPPADYHQLEQWADREDRAIDQQVTHVIRQAIAQFTRTTDPRPEPLVAA